MYKHVLIATDGSGLANKAVPHALELAKLCGAKVTAITVRSQHDDFDAEGFAVNVSSADMEAEVEEVDHHLDYSRSKSKELGVELETVQVESREPWKAIVSTAEERECDVIVMASHGRRGLSALIYGSATQGVLTHCNIPVLVYR